MLVVKQAFESSNARSCFMVLFRNAFLRRCRESWFHCRVRIMRDIIVGGFRGRF
jgi:hypothetical protein